MPQKEKIIDFLKKNDHPVSPFTLAKELKLNPNSVRARISELAKTGEIERVTRGLYSINKTHRVKNPRIQNFTAIVHPRPSIEVHDDWEYGFNTSSGKKNESFRLSLIFGKTNNKITWKIKAPQGIDYYGLILAYGFVKYVINNKGCNISETCISENKQEPRCFMVKNFEFVNDIFGRGLKGAKCYTFWDFRGNMEKIYEKHYGTRREIVYSGPIAIQDLFAFYDRGLPGLISAQSTYDLARAVEKKHHFVKEN